MPNVTISALPNATTPLDGSERVAMDKAGATVDATTQDVANLAPATNLGYNAPTRVLSNSRGTGVTLPVATGSAPGLLAAADYTLLQSAVQPGQNPAATVFAITDGGSVVINPANGALQTWTLGANRTPSASITEGSSCTIHITAGAFTINWGTVGVTWLSGAAPVLATSGITPVTLWRVGGVTYGSAPEVRFAAAGTAALGTSAIASGASASLVTVAATGVLTTDVIDWGFNGNPNGVTGYSAANTAGCLVITAYPTAGNVNFLVSNPTGSSITPGALTLNWKVQR